LPTEWSEELYENKKFEELNKCLSQLGQDLCLGLNIQEVFNRKQDQEDQREDLQDLIKKLNHLSYQQQDQYKSIDKLIHQRFESVRSHLEQHLLNKQDSNQVQDHYKFLRIPHKDLQIAEKPIGSGGFADVYKGMWLTHHDQVAVKVLRLRHLSDDSQSEIRADFHREVSTMYQIRYEHVVTVLGACIEPNFYAIIVEYMSLGSLYDVLHGQTDNDQVITLSWSDRYSLTWQMAKSINYLHNLNPCIIHRDIKSMNFLMKQHGTDQHRFLLKVCDFGLAEIRRESLAQSIQTVGSLAWKAPELFISHENHSKQSDIYSLGMTMWELATAKKPWDKYVDETVIVTLVKIEERPDISDDIPKEYKQTIEDAWNQNPYKRPTGFDLMERMCKQMSRLKEKDEIPTMAVDLHCPETRTRECSLTKDTK
jgi:serine/threonine protein kinase